MIGLVLAGGKSTRLGQDKTAVVHAGRTLLERTARLLAPHVEQVYISCRHPERLPADWPVLVDATERIGPAGGIMTALGRLGGPIFVLACDLPFMHADLIRRLIAARNARPYGSVLTAWRLEGSDYVENLVAIYESGALPLMEQGVAQGIFKLGRLVPAELRHTIPYTEKERDAFFNVNHPEDLRRLNPGGTS
jgi:molybdopterin-guanine dinucleotide biosynthesis protein A